MKGNLEEDIDSHFHKGLDILVVVHLINANANQIVLHNGFAVLLYTHLGLLPNSIPVVHILLMSRRDYNMIS